MDAWEAYAVDAAEEQGDQPAEDAISKGLESLADSASQWLAPGVEKAAAAADGLRQKGLEAANQGLAAAKDRAKLFDLNALQANDPLFAAGEQPAAPAAEPDAAPTTDDDAHARELARVKEQSLRDARRVEGEQLRENRKLSQRLAELQRAMEEATARAPRRTARWRNCGKASGARRATRGASARRPRRCGRRSATPPRRSRARGTRGAAGR